LCYRCGVKTAAEQIRRQIPTEEFDYQALSDCLKDYARPRDRISDLIKSGVIVRVKKGLYIFGSDYRRGPYSREVLANLIYGPSYVSLDYALAHHALIPERVETVTSVTCAKSRSFLTPVGRFTYRAVPLDYYRTGIDIIEISEKRSFLLATREKALADKVYHDRGPSIGTPRELEVYLFENLRINPGALRELDPGKMNEIAGHCRSRRIALLASFLRRFKESKS
jgi:predicted transcriptional regulator of viral defense system